MSIEKIAKLHGTYVKKISDLFKQYDFELRNNSERHRKYNINENYFEKIDSEEKAYWLGFLYADGNVYIKDCQYRITLGLSSSDEEHVLKFRNALGSNAPIIKQIKKFHGNYSTSTVSVFCVSNKKLSLDLSRLGCVPNKTFKTTFPTVDQLPVELQKHFIRGVFDGDGCISFSPHDESNSIPHADFQILGTQNLLNGIAKVLVDNDVVEKNVSVNIIPNQKIFRLRIGGVYNISLLRKYLYDNATVYLQRKMDKFNEIDNFDHIPNYTKINIKESEKICTVCGDTKGKFLRCHIPGEYYGKILCSRHSHQINTYGQITDPNKFKKIKCSNNGMIFNTISEAAKWCGLKNGSGITLFLQGKRMFAGKDPTTKEKLKWEAYYD